MQHHALFGTFNIERAKTILFDCVNFPILGMVLGMYYWYQPRCNGQKARSVGLSHITDLKITSGYNYQSI